MKLFPVLVCVMIMVAGIALFSGISVRCLKAMDDLHSISTDIHTIRESIAPPSVKIKFRYGPSKKDGREGPKKPIILA